MRAENQSSKLHSHGKMTGYAVFLASFEKEASGEIGVGTFSLSFFFQNAYFVLVKSYSATKATNFPSELPFCWNLEAQS